MSEISTFHDQLLKFYKAQRDYFCQKRGEVWVRDIIRWPNNASLWYGPKSTDSDADSSALSPSAGFFAFCKYLDDFRQRASECLEVSSLTKSSRIRRVTPKSDRST